VLQDSPSQKTKEVLDLERYKSMLNSIPPTAMNLESTGVDISSPPPKKDLSAEEKVWLEDWWFDQADTFVFAFDVDYYYLKNKRRCPC